MPTRKTRTPKSTETAPSPEQTTAPEQTTVETDTPEPTDAKPAKTEPSLDQMANHGMAGPLVARIRELQAEQDSSGGEGNADLKSAMETRHAVMAAAANRAIDAIAAYRDGIADAANGEAAKLTGDVSRWSQRKDGDPSTLDTFARSAANYRKARKAYLDTVTGQTSHAKEITKLTRMARQLYAMSPSS